MHSEDMVWQKQPRHGTASILDLVVPLVERDYLALHTPVIADQRRYCQAQGGVYAHVS